eukprot:gene32118-39668_t
MTLHLFQRTVEFYYLLGVLVYYLISQYSSENVPTGPHYPK